MQQKLKDKFDLSACEHVCECVCVYAVSGLTHKFDCVTAKNSPQSSPQANQKAVHHLSPAKGVSSLSYAD